AHIPAGDRRTFPLALAASLVGVTAAAIIGCIAPLNSTWMADSGSRAAGGSPQVSALGSAVLWSASPLGSLVGPAVPRQPPRAGQVPESTRPLGSRTTGQGGRHRKGHLRGDGQNGDGQNGNGQNGNGQNYGHHRGRPHGQPGTAGAAGTSASARTAGSGPQ